MAPGERATIPPNGASLSVLVVALPLVASFTAFWACSSGERESPTGAAPLDAASDVVFAPDGRMFIADDTSGKIFRVAPRTLGAP